MSQRTISGIDFQPTIRDIQENLLNFEYNLKNELEILNACIKLASSNTIQNIQDEIQSLKVQISEEIESYKDFNSQIQRRSSNLTAQESEEYNIIKLKYNKLILKVEKIYSSTPEMESITNKFPRSKLKIESQILLEQQNQQQRIQNEDTIPKSTNALSRILPKPPLSSNSMISNNSSIIQSLNPTTNYNKGAAAAADIIKSIAKRETIDENNKEFIKRELIQLKSLIQDVNKKIDTHDHTEYDMELDRLRKENNQIIHDYKILKNDNTELMHSLRTLSKMAQEIKIQNERLLLNIANPNTIASRQQQFSPISQSNNKPPISNDRRNQNEQNHQQQQYLNQQQIPIRLSNHQFQQNNKEEQRISIQSPINMKNSNMNIISPQLSKNNNFIMNKEDNSNRHPHQFEYKESSNRVLTRNSSSHATNGNNNMNGNNKCLTEANQKIQGQRSLIPSQQSYREGDVDYDLLSSWARKRLMDN